MDDVSPPVSRPRWQRGCVLVISMVLIGVVGFCAVSGAVVRRGLIRPPWVVRDIGPLRLVALETFTPQCAFAFPCGQPLRVFDPHLPRYYVVWVIVSLPASGRSETHSYRLVAQPLDWK